ncbi:hypothetical protein PSTG_17314 [Puccinia striiformis f. sp. tritici PST-78]|uniref:Uncharacterized protein n=1 Tax=Puccinia striiformis f. sp. tritici PST-78 TaxID=1165861 RepID=A0A0L0UR28_9BASI|nr:hypothetical protein PSTG_17314 [Puccinia striiformis f. sp. tritici PST-78]
MADFGNALSGLIDSFSLISGGEDSPQQAKHYEILVTAELGRVHNAYVVFWDGIHNRPDPLELISQLDIRKELWDQLQSKRLPSLRRQINSLANALISSSSDHQNKPVSKLKLVLKILTKLDTTLGKIKFAIACISPDIEPIKVKIDQDFKKLKTFVCCRLQLKIYRVNEIVCDLLQSAGRFYQRSGHEIGRNTREKTVLLDMRNVCIEAIDGILEYMDKSELRIVQDDWKSNIESINQSLKKFTFFSNLTLTRNQELKKDYIRHQISQIPRRFNQTEEDYLQSFDHDFNQHFHTTCDATRSMISAIKLSRLFISRLYQISQDRENFKMRSNLSTRELDVYVTMSTMLSEGIKEIVNGLTSEDENEFNNNPRAITQAIDHLITTPEAMIPQTIHVFQSTSDLASIKIFLKAWFYEWNHLHSLATKPFSNGINTGLLPLPST